VTTALDPAGDIWLAGATTGQFPTENAFQSEFGGGGTDVFLAELSFGEELQISFAGPTVMVSWPAHATNYVLETTAMLPAVSWAMVTNTPSTTTNERSVQLPLTSHPAFFRLREQ